MKSWTVSSLVNRPFSSIILCRRTLLRRCLLQDSRLRCRRRSPSTLGWYRPNPLVTSHEAGLARGQHPTSPNPEDAGLPECSTRPQPRSLLLAVLTIHPHEQPSSSAKNPLRSFRAGKAICCASVQVLQRL